MNDAIRQEVINDAWQRLVLLSTLIREDSSGFVYHSQRLSSCKKRMLPASGSPDQKAMFLQSRRHVNTIRQAGSDFLKEHGFTTGGLRKKVNPHAPKK